MGPQLKSEEAEVSPTFNLFTNTGLIELASNYAQPVKFQGFDVANGQFPHLPTFFLPLKPHKI